MRVIEGFIFDLDGVIVDTARLHTAAWEGLARHLGIPFDPSLEHRLRGVSRRESLDIILRAAGREASEAERQHWAELKNAWYVESLATLGPRDLLPGVEDFMRAARSEGYRLALGSASKNAPRVLEVLGITSWFDAVADGNTVDRAKPDPAVFLAGAAALGLDPRACVVFEDAAAGAEAARAGGLACVGIGEPSVLGAADMVVPSFRGLNPSFVVGQLAPLISRGAEPPRP